MSIWSRIVEAVSALAAGESLGAVFDRLRGPADRSVAFTIAVIALGAKMAKADGQVTRDEVAAFRRVFRIAPEDEKAAARVFNLARQDVAGFEAYATRIGRMFREDQRVLEDLMDGLFHIAVADGVYDPREDAFLREVAGRLGLGERCFRIVRARHVEDAEPDPYHVLGVSPETPYADVRAAWRALVRDSHPDAMIARGVPEEAIEMAEKRLVRINRAWEQISANHRKSEGFASEPGE